MLQTSASGNPQITGQSQIPIQQQMTGQQQMRYGMNPMNQICQPMQSGLPRTSQITQPIPVYFFYKF